MKRLLLDRSPGETRGVVLLDGRPERLLIEREGEAGRPRLGERWRGRIRSISRAFRGAFVDLGQERDGLMKLADDAGLSEGAAVEALVVAEGRREKGPALKFLSPSSGGTGRLEAQLSLEVRLRTFASDAAVEEGEVARDAADEAEDAVLARSFALARGLTLTIDPSRALTAVDVDQGDAAASRKTVLAANCTAVMETARLLRLKGLGGLVVVDLVGAPREQGPLIAAAKEAFGADEPGVVYAGISRLGLFEIAKPWRERPISETLLDADGAISARSVAHRLLRALEREARFDPGARIEGICATEVAAIAQPFVAKLGPRFSVAGEVGRARTNTDIRRR